MFKRVLLTTDGSPVVERQILYAEHLARVEPADLLVFHAYMPPLQYADTPGYEALLQSYQPWRRRWPTTRWRRCAMPALRRGRRCGPGRPASRLSRRRAPSTPT